jgi:hypothetical protein
LLDKKDKFFMDNREYIVLRVENGRIFYRGINSSVYSRYSDRHPSMGAKSKQWVYLIPKPGPNE